jgi:hypothetical protein
VVQERRSVGKRAGERQPLGKGSTAELDSNSKDWRGYEDRKVVDQMLDPV